MATVNNIKKQNPLRNALVHLFKTNGSYFLFDAASSSALEIDDKAFQLIRSLKSNSRKKESGCFPEKYTRGDNFSVWQELMNLKNWGLFRDFRPLKSRLSIDSISSYRPSHFVLMTTERCNLSCKYCYENGRQSEGSKIDMSEEIACKAVDYLLENSSQRECGLTFFGGEPLVNFGLIRRAVAYAKQSASKKGKSFYFSMTTNGTLLKRNIVDFLKKEKFRLLVSFDGPQDVHDASRIFSDGSGSYDVVRNNLRELQKISDIHFSVRATLTNQCTSLSKLSRYFEREGFSKTHIQPVSSQRFGKNGLGLNVNRKVLRKLYQEYQQLADDVLEKWKAKKPIVFNPYKDYLEWLHSNAQRKIACGVCRGMLTIGADGLIYPCQRFSGMKNFVVGNVDDWIDVRKIQEIYRSFDKAREVCHQCWALPLCAGACMHDWILADGSFSTAEPENCAITRRLIELSIYIYSRWVLFKEDKNPRGN